MSVTCARTSRNPARAIGADHPLVTAVDREPDRPCADLAAQSAQVFQHLPETPLPPRLMQEVDFAQEQPPVARLHAAVTDGPSFVLHQEIAIAFERQLLGNRPHGLEPLDHVGDLLARDDPAVGFVPDQPRQPVHLHDVASRLDFTNSHHIYLNYNKNERSSPGCTS